MMPFLYTVVQLLFDLADATNRMSDSAISAKSCNMQMVTVVSWLTYLVIYVLPMIGFASTEAWSPINATIASPTYFRSVMSVNSCRPR